VGYTVSTTGDSNEAAYSDLKSKQHPQRSHGYPRHEDEEEDCLSDFITKAREGISRDQGEAACWRH
jgi:hypothetical protein